MTNDFRTRYEAHLKSSVKRWIVDNPGKFEQLIIEAIKGPRIERDKEFPEYLDILDADEIG